MKKCLLLISIAALAFSGCKKEQQNASNNIPSAENSTQTESVKSTPAQPTLTTVPGVMLWDPNGSLWLEGDDGVMTWGKVDLQFGTQIEIVCDAAKNPEIKTSKRKSGGKIEDREFVRVKYDGKDNYWAQTALVSVNAKPAIVIENDTLIYNNPVRKNRRSQPGRRLLTVRKNRCQARPELHRHTRKVHQVGKNRFGRS